MRKEMPMSLFEAGFEVPAVAGHKGLLTHLRLACEQHVSDGESAVRFVVTSTSSAGYRCEYGAIRSSSDRRLENGSIFDFRPRLVENGSQFNVVLLVPTGVGAEIGGHAGDAGPVAQMLAEISDTLILHPNVVNASDLNRNATKCSLCRGKCYNAAVNGDGGISTGSLQSSSGSGLTPMKTSYSLIQQLTR